MKKVMFVFFVIIFVLMSGGCKREYVYQPVTTDAAVQESTTEEAVTQAIVQQPAVTETTVEISTEVETTEVQSTEAASESLYTEVDLSIEMPDKNGTMEVDPSSENKFIKAVNKERNIGSDRLVAVYAVPESGQNYVFEFKDAKGREADDLKKVYLLDDSCKITGVASTASGEREGISSVENWFCMNVLIKEIIFPAVSEQF